MRRRQQGSVLLVYALVFAFVAAAGAAVVLKYNSAIEGRQVAEKRADEAEKAAEGWKKIAVKRKGDSDAAQRIAKQRADERDVARAQLDGLLGDLARLEAANKAAADWAAAAVPDAVRGLRRLNAGCSADPALRCPPLESGGDGGAANAGRDQSRTPAGGDGTARGASAG